MNEAERKALGNGMPILCTYDIEPNRYVMFARLRSMWKEAGEGRSYAQLADLLGVPKQAIAQWATGTGSKSPAPWYVIMRLCFWLGLAVAVEPGGAKLYKMPDVDDVDAD